MLQPRLWVLRRTMLTSASFHRGCEPLMAGAPYDATIRLAVATQIETNLRGFLSVRVMSDFDGPRETSRRLTELPDQLGRASDMDSRSAGAIRKRATASRHPVIADDSAFRG